LIRSASAIANNNAQELNAIHTSEIKQNSPGMMEHVFTPGGELGKRCDSGI
jgi:hypothetical protein